MNVLVAILTLEVIVLIVTTLRHKLNETEIQQGKTDPELKEAIIEKHPYATMSYRQFKTLLKTVPEKFAIWYFDTANEDYWRLQKPLAFRAVKYGWYHRLDPKRFYDRNLNSYIPGDVQLSKHWNKALFNIDTAYWPLLISFGGDLPETFDTETIQNIPKEATLLFFDNQAITNRALNDLISYCKETSLQALGITEEQKNAPQKKLQNCINGSKNLIREMQTVQKKAEMELKKAQNNERRKCAILSHRKNALKKNHE